MTRWQKIRELIRDILLPLIAALVGFQCIRDPAPRPAPPGPADPPPAPAPAPIPAPPPPPADYTDPAGATVKITAGPYGCTATILSLRPGPGRYYLLSAYHCIRGVNGPFTVHLGDGRKVPFRVVRTNATADLALLEFAAADGLPVAQVADSEPSPGVPIWHQGFGVDRPGNRETGTVAGRVDRNGQLPMTLSVSSGDSGSGIFRSDNGQLIAVVCCTGGGRTYGGTVQAIRQLIAGGAAVH